MMRKGRVKQSVMDRSVKRILGDVLPEHFDGGGMSYQCEGWTLAPERLVYGIVHETMAVRQIPAVIDVTMLFPETTEEAQLKQFMKRLRSLCQKEGVRLGQIRVSASYAVSDLIAFACVTKNREEKSRKDNGKDDKNREGNRRAVRDRQDLTDFTNLDVVVAGAVGSEGAAILAAEYQNELKKRYAGSFIEQAQCLYEDASMAEAREIFFRDTVAKVYAAGEGGIFAAFWNLALHADVGLDLRLKSVPIRQHTIEVCEYYNLNPYLLYSGGSFVLFCEKGEEVVSGLEKVGVTSAVVGSTTGGKDRIIRYDDEIRYLEPPQADEFYKVWRL